MERRNPSFRVYLQQGGRRLETEDRRRNHRPIPGKVFKLELLFPNLWQNYIAEKVRILGIFVPVDETHTLLYMRFYQSFLRVPLLRGLVNLIGGFYNLIIAQSGPPA